MKPWTWLRKPRLGVSYRQVTLDNLYFSVTERHSLNDARMLNIPTRWIPNQIKQRLKKVLGLPVTRLQADWDILRTIGPVAKPHVVLDIGAHHGWFLHSWKDWCPSAEIHAFEPFPESHARAVELYGADPSITINQKGVGDDITERDLYVLADSLVSNSFLSPRHEKWDEIEFHTGQITKTKVSTTTVDQYCLENRISSVYLMKVDVQGYELKVLRGAEATLRHVDYIFIESAIQPLYAEAAQFTTVAECLMERGFHLMAMQAWHRGNHKLVETDMLFRRNELAPPIDPSIGRIYERIG